MDIQEAMTLVIDHWHFDEQNYPAIQGLSGDEKRFFALRHVLLHQTKAVGGLSKVLEPGDHGMPIDKEALRPVVQKFFINTIRLALLSGLSGEELSGAVKRWAEENKKK